MYEPNFKSYACKQKVKDKQINCFMQSFISVSGYFISTKISNIKSISVKLIDLCKNLYEEYSGEKIFHCTNLTLETQYKKINEQLIYVPLDCEKINSIKKHSRVK